MQAQKKKVLRRRVQKKRAQKKRTKRMKRLPSMHTYNYSVLYTVVHDTCWFCMVTQYLISEEQIP
jgi:hypothetical protein